MELDEDRFRVELDQARAGLADLEAEYAALADPDNIALDDEHDSEGATIGFERARVAGLIERARGRISSLEDAAQRTRDGTYGLCSSCGRGIGAARLAALPATRVCIECAHQSRMGQ